MPARDTKRLALAGFDLKVAVNISGQQLADAWFPDAVASHARMEPV